MVQECLAKNNLKILRGVSRCHLAKKKSKNFKGSRNASYFTGDKSMIQFCYILDNYYTDYPDLVKILDIDDDSKHNVRTHLCLSITYLGNTILIPLRKNLGSPVRPYGTIGFSVPSKSKPYAGLDYRYIMIVNDNKYLRYDTPRISRKQLQIISDNYSTIENEAIEYVNSYIRVAKKNRVERTARFRESSLINFHSELKI